MLRTVKLATSAALIRLFARRELTTSDLNRPDHTTGRPAGAGCLPIRLPNCRAPCAINATIRRTHELPRREARVPVRGRIGDYGSLIQDRDNATKLVNELVEAADEKQLAQDRPLWPHRPALYRRTRLHEIRPPRRRTSLPKSSPNAKRREEPPSRSPATNLSSAGPRTFTRPPPVRRGRRPAHLHRNRHRLVPAQPHPCPTLLTWLSQSGTGSAS